MVEEEEVVTKTNLVHYEVSKYLANFGDEGRTATCDVFRSTFNNSFWLNRFPSFSLYLLFSPLVLHFPLSFPSSLFLEIGSYFKNETC